MKPKTNAALKMAIFQSGYNQGDIAVASGLSDSKLSRIIRGYAQPTRDEKRLLALALRSSQAALFPVLEAVAP